MIAKQAGKSMLHKQAFAPAHVGITVFDPEANKYIYNHNGDKLFIPASNTKLFSLYAGLKYLGDSIIGARYRIIDTTIQIETSGDPTFLHPDFANQPLYNFLNQPRFKKIELHTSFAAKPLGRGWAWDDYAEDYMAERDPFPMYGNLATFTYKNDILTTVPSLPVAGKPEKNQPWNVSRNLGGHFFIIQNGKGNTVPTKQLTIAMESGAFASRLLADTLHKDVTDIETALHLNDALVLYSQPKDSLFKIMMHRSDNFFAEQTLLMASNERLGIMSDSRMIDTLLKTDLKALPQQPKWVDGSGLSRYNLFSPQDFVWLLNKLKTENNFERLKVILPTGNEGTLKGLYINNQGNIFAKTGTLSNTVALSGYLITQKNKTLLFSVLINNHQSTASLIRKGIEDFLTRLIEKY